MEDARINKYLAAFGLASRRAIDDMIRAGRIAVNGEVVTTPGIGVKPADTITVDGQAVKTQTKLVYYLLNKPPGVVTTARDEKGRITALALVPKQPRVFPVGRLDVDSQGLLLLTNDGAVTHRLTHPSFSVPKTYRVTVTGVVSPQVIKRLAAGMTLKEGITSKALVTKGKIVGNQTALEMTIHQGWHRQIRRMSGVVGLTVTKLERIAVGPLRLGDLPLGQFRELRQAEVANLHQACGLYQ